jgi:hypothetical protein
VQPAVQSGTFQGGLDFLDEAPDPDVLLLPVVDGEKRLLGGGAKRDPRLA